MVSIIDRLMRLLSRHFKVEKTDRALKVYPNSGGRFSRRDWDNVAKMADRYDATVTGMGYILITKKRGHQGQKSEREGSKNYHNAARRRSNGT